jgi:TonB-linked SusC/RagA family outer membrane protein
MDFKALYSPSFFRRRDVHQTLRIMRFTGFLLLVACLQVSAGSFGQTVTLSVKNSPLARVLDQVKQQTGLSIFWDEQALKDARRVTLDLKNATLEQALDACLQGQELTYHIVENLVIIRPKLSATGESQPPVLSPPTDIHGRITDSLGNPLAGASVTVKGSKKGTSTDAQGNFDLKGLDSKATIIISFTGFESQEIRLNGRHEFVVQLKQGATQLLDVVVNKGYYSTNERLNTGDVTVVKGEDIQKQPVSDPIMALEGRVPGLNIQQASGAPGSYSTIQIRGQNSIANGNDPLYIVDGVPFSSISLSSPNISGGALGYGNFLSNSPGGGGGGGGISPFNALNPSDIENIIVLKDADATAIYGSRGANGVILITTKKGKAGDSRIDLNVYTGSGEVTRMMHLLNTSQYLAMRREAFENDGLALPSITSNPQDNNYDINGVWDTTRYTNWQKALIGNSANFTNAQGSVSGGNANTQYVVGAGYSKQGTAFIGNYFDQKGSARLNLSHTNPNQRFHLQAGASYVYDNNDLPGQDFANLITLAPDAPALYDKNGNINWQYFNGSSTFGNPAASTLINFRAATNNLISNLNLSYQLLAGLQLKCSAGYNRDEMNQKQITPSTSSQPPFNLNQYSRSYYFATTTVTAWSVEPQLDYQHGIGDGKLEALVGTTFQQRNQNSLTQYAYGFASDALIENPQAASAQGVQGSFNTLYRYNALFGRLGYNLNDKYLVNVTARRDGSSRFGPGKQFGNFGAVGLGWVFSKEQFIKNSIPILSFGKLRGSYGTTGNDQISDYQYLRTYSSISSTYQGITGLFPTQLTNPYFAWEAVKKLEGGLELGFAKDRILISGSFYRNRTGNQLVGYSLPLVTGFSSVQFNLPAVVQNTGLELTLNTINIKTKHFTWTTSANLTVPRNKLVAFPNIENFSAYNSRYIVGKSLFIQELFHSTGVDPLTGLYSFATKNSGGIPSNPQDLQPTQPVTQKYYGGVDNRISYKGFELDIFIQFVNQLGYSYRKFLNSPGQNNQNQPTDVLNRWRVAGDVTNIQRYSTNQESANLFSILALNSDATITDASFLRLKNLALSYQLPNSLNSGLHLKSARIYLQCQNLFTVTKYLGLDPETQGLTLPPLRMITAGLQMGF